MENKTVGIKLNTVNAILQYLGKQPYEEVANFIGALHTEIQPQLQKPDLVEESEE